MSTQPHVSSCPPRTTIEQRVLDAFAFLDFADHLLPAVKDLTPFELLKIPSLRQSIIIKPLEVELRILRPKNFRSGNTTETGIN